MSGVNLRINVEDTVGFVVICSLVYGLRFPTFGEKLLDSSRKTQSIRYTGIQVGLGSVHASFQNHPRDLQFDVLGTDWACCASLLH